MQPEQAHRSLVVSTETAGLGNRIKSWVSAMRLGSEARVVWPITKFMPARFEDLFENDVAADEIPDGAREYKSWRLAILPEDESYLPAGFAVVGGGANTIVRGIGKLFWQVRGKRTDRYRYMLFPKTHSKRSTRADGRNIDLEYGRIPEHFRNVYCPLFADIRFHRSLLAAANEWALRHIDEDVIGVQVRTWRDDPRRHRKYHLPARKRLLRLMRATREDRRFLVVSDSDEVVDLLRAEFGSERILERPRSTSRDSSWQSGEGAQEDLIDMLLLARTQAMYVSYLSTFSEAAWWLGGARAEVAVF